jgi:hypothetical protein
MSANGCSCEPQELGVREIQTEGHTLAQAVSRRPLTPEAWVRVQISPCGICGG